MSLWVYIKLVHILAGVFWIGAAVVTTFFILPAVQAAGPAGGAVMKQLTGQRKLPQYINLAAAAATLCGLLLYWQLTGGFAVNLLFNDSLRWMALSIGSLSGLAAFLWGFLVQSRNAKRLGQLTAGISGPPSPEQLTAVAALQHKLHRGGMVGIALLLVSLIGMVLTHPV